MPNTQDENAGQAAAGELEPVKKETRTKAEIMENAKQAAAIATEMTIEVANEKGAENVRLSDVLQRTNEKYVFTANEIQEAAEAGQKGLSTITPRVIAILQELTRFTEELKRAEDAFFCSNDWDVLRDAFPDITQADASILIYTGLCEPLIENLDAVKEKATDHEQKTGRKMRFSDLINIDDSKETLDYGLSLLERFLGELDALPPAEPQESTQEQAVQQAAVSKLTALSFPLDKVNADIWAQSEATDGETILYKMETQRQTPAKGKAAKPKRKQKELTLYYTIDFGALDANEYKISKRLTNTDKRIYLAVAALYNAGNDIVTLTEIYRAMGNTGSPSKAQLKKINAAITKMGRAWITVDDSEEHREYNYNIHEQEAGWNNGVYDGPLLAIERQPLKTGFRGRTTEKAIHIFREPAMVTFARLRQQITTVEIKLLQSPISKTEGNLAIEDYLLQRISRAKNGHSRHLEKILLKTLYEKTGITDRKQIQRAPEKIETYLKFYVKSGYLTHYEMDSAKTFIIAYF